jgi:putative membrane protein
MLSRFQYHPARAGYLLAATAALLTLACSERKEATPGTAMDSAGMMAGQETTAQAAAPALNDAQIAHIAVTADAIDSAAGKYALEKGSSKAVKDFAQTMVNDHGAVNRQAVALATKLGVTPEDNNVSKQLMDGADQAHSNLETLTGAAFDRAYMDREIAYHQAVLDALDSTLIPGAQNAELKALLTAVRPNFVAHLARAKSVRSGLGA